MLLVKEGTDPMVHKIRGKDYILNIIVLEEEWQSGTVRGGFGNEKFDAK
jgi:hypothetical protein